MKRLISLTFILVLTPGWIFGAEILRPSLETEMKRQEAILRQNIITEKKRANSERLAQIQHKNRSLRNAKVQKSLPLISSTPHTPKILGSITPEVSSEKIIISSPSANIIPGVDMGRVQESWFSWYNATRSSLGLTPFRHDSRLDKTASDWNTIFAASKGQNHHRRNATDGYYDFSKIDAWFIERGVNPKVINRTKHVENVGYGYYRCSESDCTDELIQSIRSTYDFFMSEKGKSYDPHYRSIINPNFTKIGLDVIVVPAENRYYITIHYITE